MTIAGRLEAYLTVPTAVTITATNSGGGPTAVSLTAGNYTPTELVAHVVTRLNAVRTPATWSGEVDYETGLVTLDCSGEKLTKTGGTNVAWDATGYSVTSIAGDGYVQFTATAAAEFNFLGLAATNATAYFSSIEHGFYLDAAGVLKAYESGSIVYTGTWAVGSVLTVKRVGTTITFLKDGVLLYTSLTASTGAKIIDTALLETSSTLESIRLFDDGTEVAITWTSDGVTATTNAWALTFTTAAAGTALGFGYTGATIAKSGGVNGAFDAGVSSVQSIAADGYLQLRATETNRYRIIGLATTDPGASYESINFGIYLNGDGNAYVAESGTTGVFNSGAYAAGDLFRVTRAGSVVSYQKNGSTFYTSLVSSSGALVIDSSFYDSGGTVSGIILRDRGAAVNLTWQTGSNVTVGSAFSGNIASRTTAATSDTQARGLWIPDCHILMSTHPATAPEVSDARSTSSGTGRVITLAGVFKYRHPSLGWRLVDVTRTWEHFATTPNSSWQQWWRDTQVGRGHSWFSPGSAFQAYYDSGGSAAIVGAELNSGAGPTNGWKFLPVPASCEARIADEQWLGLWTIETPAIVAGD
jgi:hypothetical protein